MTPFCRIRLSTMLRRSRTRSGWRKGSKYPGRCTIPASSDRKSTRLNSSHLSLHDALPIFVHHVHKVGRVHAGGPALRDRQRRFDGERVIAIVDDAVLPHQAEHDVAAIADTVRMAEGVEVSGPLHHTRKFRSEEHTSELQSPFPTRRSSDLRSPCPQSRARPRWWTRSSRPSAALRWRARNRDR